MCEVTILKAEIPAEKSDHFSMVHSIPAQSQGIVYSLRAEGLNAKALQVSVFQASVRIQKSGQRS